MKIINRFFTALAVIAFIVIPGLARADDVYTDNLVIVMDDSGSMSGGFGKTSRMEAAKEALRTVLATVPETTWIGLVALNADWLYDLGPRNNVQLNTAINSLQPTGGTPLGQYIKKGADRLFAQREAQHGYGSYRLLVITDGECEAEPMNRNAIDIVRRGIRLDAIGVGMEKEHSLAKKSHSYRSANDAAALQRAITEVLAEIGNTGSSAVTSEAFDAIRGLPDGTVTAILTSLTTIENHPTGEKPTVPPPTVPQTSSGGAGAGGAADCNGGNGCNHAPGMMFIFVALYLVRPTRKRRRFE